MKGQVWRRFSRSEERFWKIGPLQLVMLELSLWMKVVTGFDIRLMRAFDESHRDSLVPEAWLCLQEELHFVGSIRGTYNDDLKAG